jgi:large subunit ribosomal protein L25
MLKVYEKKGLKKGYNRKLKEENLIPAVVYGVGIDKTIAVELNPSDFVKTINNPKRYNSTFDVEITRLDGKIEIKRVFLKSVQKHPFKDEYVHLDFYVYNPTEKHVFQVPFKTIGRAEGVIAGGKLKVALKKIKISAVPDMIPEEFICDITSLQRGGVIRISDLQYPEGVIPMYSASQALVSVSSLKLGPNGVENKTEELVFD